MYNWKRHTNDWKVILTINLKWWFLISFSIFSFPPVCRRHRDFYWSYRFIIQQILENWTLLKLLFENLTFLSLFSLFKFLCGYKFPFFLVLYHLLLFKLFSFENNLNYKLYNLNCFYLLLVALFFIFVTISNVN